MSNKIHSWGGYPSLPQQGRYLHRRADVCKSVAELTKTHGTTLVFGNGRSYGDSCLATSGHILIANRMNKFISFDRIKGVLKAEAGVTLQEILEVCIPYGWFLAVTPGTKFVTLGGAIANDVHGKNHHIRGTFSRYVNAFGLIREGLDEITCSTIHNTKFFKATIGGLGLTGVITWAEIQLIPVQSTQINTRTVRFSNLESFFKLSNELDHKHEYSVAWIDCLAKGVNTGRGVLILGDHAEFGELSNDQKAKIRIPLTPPISLVNSFSLKPFNEIYWRLHPKELTEQRAEYEPFFYPLDRLLHWNRIYGRPGFQQYQCVIPEDVAYPAIKEILTTIANSGQGSFLAVMKRCGAIQSQGLLSFPIPGTSLALDFPQNNYVTQTLFPKLDSIVRETGGRLYPAKDAHMTSRDFQAAYPNWKKMEELRDPSILSAFWSRVTS